MRPRAYQTVISSPEDSPENSPENISISSASRVYRPISSSSESSAEKLIASPSPVPLPDWSPGFDEDLNKLFERRPDDLLTVEDDAPERLSGSTAQDLLNFPEIDEVTAEDLKNLYDDPQTLQPSGSTALQPYEGNKNASHLTGVWTSELDENLKKLPVEDDHKGKSIEGGDASTDPTGFGDHLDDYDLDDDLGDDLEDDHEDDPRTDIQKVDHIAEICVALKDVKKRAKEAHDTLSDLGVDGRCLFDINEAVRLLGIASNFLLHISDKPPSVPRRSRNTKRKKRTVFRKEPACK